MVHLSHVRLPAPRAGRHRGHHPQPVLPGVRDSPPAVRLVRHPRRGHRSAAAPDRVCPPEYRAHRHVQALPAPHGGGGRGVRLGRSPHAHAGGHAPPRLSRQRRAGLHGPRGRGQGRLHRGGQPAGSLRARGSGRQRTPRHGCAEPAEAHLFQLGGGQGGRVDRGEPSRSPRDGHPHRALHQARLHRAGGLHGGAGEEVLPPGPRQGGSPEGRLHHPLRRGRKECGGRDRRADLLRGSGQPLRQRGREPQGQGHAALAERH